MNPADDELLDLVNDIDEVIGTINRQHTAQLVRDTTGFITYGAKTKKSEP